MIDLKVNIEGEERAFQMPESWEEVSVGLFEDIAQMEVSNVDLGNSMTIISALTGMNQELLWQVPVNEMPKILEHVQFIKQPIEDDPKESITIDGEEYFMKKDFDNLTYGETISLDIIQKEFGEQVQKAFGKMLCVFLRKKIDGKLEPHLPEHLDRLEMFRTKVMISDVYQLFVFFSSGKNTSTKATKDSLEVVEIKNETDTKA